MGFIARSLVAGAATGGVTYFLSKNNLASVAVFSITTVGIMMLEEFY
jgi:hypothetical protein